MKQKIRSLQELKDWNENPTTDLPILYEWFLEWFFEELLMKNKFPEAYEAHEEHIKFGMICNNFTRKESTDRADENLKYYSGYAQQWEYKLSAFKDYVGMLDIK